MFLNRIGITDIVKPKPLQLKKARYFLELFSYFCRFLINLSKITKPLLRLTEKMTAPIFAHREFELPIILYTDASDCAIGGVMSQKMNEVEQAIAYVSRTFSETEIQYCIMRKVRFDLPTLLVCTKNAYNFQKSCRIGTSLEILTTIQMNIKNTPDRQHSNAYELSRKPCLQCVILNQDKNVVPVQLLLTLERKTSADAEQCND
ncbi:POL2-like protein, partial [Mya arenaria]